MINCSKIAPSVAFIGWSFFLLFVDAAFAGDHGRALVGFVELPSVFGHRYPDGPPGQLPPDAPGEIPLRAKPSAASPVIGHITDPGSVASEEFDYEARAAVVYKLSGGWALLRLNTPQQQFGWMAPEYGGPFHPFEEVVANGLSYLTEGWDRRLYDKPSGSSLDVPLQDSLERRPDIDVIEASGTGNEAWLLVKVLARGRCERPGDPVVIARGWIRIHAPDGQRNVWLYPRGC